MNSHWVHWLSDGHELDGSGYTECDILQAGYNRCRSYIWTTHVVAKGSGYQQTY